MIRVNGPGQLTWANIIITVGFVLTLVATMGIAGWTLFQTQFAAQDRLIQEIRSSSERMIGNLRRDMQKDDTDIKSEILILRKGTIERSEFDQLTLATRDRLDKLDKQLQLLESTRPTTGELQSTSRALDSQVNRVEERLRSLEAYVRGDPRPRVPDSTR